MFPVIGKIGPVSIYSYGLMLAIAIIMCAFFLSRDAREKSITSETIFDLIFWTVLGGILGARLLFIFFHLAYFFEYPLEIFMVQKGGLAWQGGLILGGIFALIFTKRKKLSLPMMLELVAPYIALGQSIGRVGCFLNGCCFGKTVAWGIYFPVHQQHLHPTQLYSSFGLLLIFFIIKRYQRFVLVPGNSFVLYLILASVLRFMIEFFRDDHDSLFFGLSTYQYVCLGIVMAAIYVHSYLKSRSR